MKRLFSISLFVAGLWLGTATARGDTFELANEGKIEGELVNKTETPRQKFMIRTESGGEITLDKSQVLHIAVRNEFEAEYEKIRGDYPDTAQGQWDLATWCLKHSLAKQRQVHLERVIALDPDNKDARGALNYSFVDGKWVHPDELQKQRGYVFYKGAWMLPQQVELLEQTRKDELARKEWFIKLKRWRASVDARADKASALQDELLAINDPSAVPALTQLFNNERNMHVKKLLLEELVQINVQSATNIVVVATLDDPDEDVRLTALDKLTSSPNHPNVTAVYVRALKSKDNVQVNRAAVCLASLKDKSAISPLIDALITTHKFKEVSSANPGQMSTTFGNGPGGGGGGLSVGAKPQTFMLPLKNQEVLKALVVLTESAANFEFDVKAWKTWYASQKKPVNVDARRG